MLKTATEASFDLNSISDVERLRHYLDWIPISIPYRAYFVRKHPDQAVAYHRFLIKTVFELSDYLFPVSRSDHDTRMTQS